MAECVYCGQSTEDPEAHHQEAHPDQRYDPVWYAEDGLGHEETATNTLGELAEEIEAELNREQTRDLKTVEEFFR